MHLLIIDDTQADHDIAVECLTDAGGDYHFYHAYNANDGIEKFNKYPIECVLLDYHMPGPDGLEVLKQLTTSGKSTPIIMMTGEGNEFVAVTAMKLGSQDYIPKKTLTPSALKRAVERAVERSELMHRMERYRSELERSNHDLEQFANIVAHDLKSPLRAVTQHLKLVRSKFEGDMDEKTMRSIDFAVDGATRMRNLIDALFEYARLGFSKPVMEPVDMGSILSQIKRDLSVTIEETQALITNDPLPCVLGDAILLSQLLQNLVANAIKYCTETPRIHISAKQDKEGWRIEVQDNGIGIASTQHQQIFSIFRRLHQQDEYPGIGLGLAICDRIVKQHGGLIGVKSEPNQGSLFYFTLPARAEVEMKKQKVAYG